MFRVLDMLGVELTDKPTPKGQSTQTGKGKRRGQQAAAPEHDDLALDDEALFGFRLMQRIKDDLAGSKVLDAIMRPSSVADLTLVIALASEFLPEGAFDNLLSGDFTVLGKVTQIVEGNDDISLYRRTVFSYLESSDFDEMFVKLSDDAGLKTSGNPMTIEAPALQLMPLAIYA